MDFNPGIQMGSILTNEQLTEIFRCSPQGGMRRSLSTNTLAIVSNHIKSIYEDRWIDNVFHYTGMGQFGDQDINGTQNKTLVQSGNNGVQLHLFEVFEDMKYTYMGQVVLAGDPYQESQADANGKNRLVWVFPLRLVNGQSVFLPNEILKQKEQRQRRKACKLSDTELASRADKIGGRPGSRQVSTTTYERNGYIAEYARRRAEGVCQLCEQSAPFLDGNGGPYLESHHIIWLSRGGEDSIENSVALCPNCHRKMHILDVQGDREKLVRAAAEYL